MCPQPARTCQVCNEAVSKYKCPSCLSPYCSLTCFKKHKETPCAKPASVEEKPSLAAPAQELRQDRPLHVDEPGEVLQKIQLEDIASSSEIRKALEDKNLQKLIRDIDSSPDALNDIDKAMDVEAFRVFADKVLSNISP